MEAEHGHAEGLVGEPNQGRTRQALLVAPAIISTIAVLYLILGPGIGAFPASLGGWSAAAAVSSWLAFVFRSSRYATLLVALTAVTLIHTGIATPVLSPAISPGPHLAAALLWAALLIPPAWVLALAAYVPLAYSVTGATVSFSLSPPETGAIWAPELGVFLIIPVAAAAVLAASARETRAEHARLRAHQEELEASLARKARELDLSVDQLIETQKLESVRTIAAGLAHELNNTLTPVMGLAEMLASGKHGDDAERFGKRILGSAISAASISEALMAYTRQGTFSPVRTDICSLLETEVLPPLARRVPPGVRLETDLDSKIAVSADRALLRQCMESLVANAVDALQGNGVIRVRALTGTSDDGARVCRLTVADDGMGIPPDQLDRVFDPFYTTKGPARARGLGLAMVEGAVTRHGGRVWIDSTPGQGTSVTLELPLLATEADPASSGERVRQPVVLVLSPEPDVHDVVEELLTELGCRTVSARSPEDGLRAVEDEHPDLLIIDDAVSDESDDVITSCGRRTPPIPVIVTVNEPSSPGVRSMDADPDHTIVRGPLDPDILSPLVTSLLGDAPMMARGSASAAG